VPITKENNGELLVIFCPVRLTPLENIPFDFGIYPRLFLMGNMHDARWIII
jgi:hypothetical protein